MATVYPQQPVMGQAGMMVVPGAPVMMMAPQGAQVLGVGAGGPGLQQLAMILGAQTELHIRQHVPKAAICEGACCEIRNKYYVSAGSDGKGAVLLEASEAGSCMDRTCCKPYHSRVVYVYPAGAAKEQSILTIDHPGIECCICSSPKPCLGEFAFCDCCLDGVNVYDGLNTDGKPGHLGGEPISRIKMPAGGGGCTPTLVVDDKAYIEGPTCFGGWSECCVESKFTYSTSKGGAGDIATFTHLKPKDCGGACREACTDSDNFGVTFAAGATAEQKADALSAAILVDYMFFEKDQGLCHATDDGACLCFTCFLCYCYGATCPCNLALPLKGGGGGPVAPEHADDAGGALVVAQKMERATTRAPSVTLVNW